MIASVSSVAREYLGGRSGFMRSRYNFISGRLWKRQPVDRLTTSMPLPAQSSLNSSNNSLIVSDPTPGPRGLPWSSTSTYSFFRLWIDNGSWAHSKAVSRTLLASAVSIAILWLHSHARKKSITFSEAYDQRLRRRLLEYSLKLFFSDARADARQAGERD